MPGCFPLCCLVTCPQQGTVEVVERCGAFNRVASPGCNCINCAFGECVRGTVSIRTQMLTVACETKTQDNVFVVLRVAVQYAVILDKVYEAFYKLTNPAAQIEAYVYDVVRSSVPKIKLDDVFTTKDEISASIKRELSESMADYGFYIQATPITDIDPAADVKMSMNEINKQQRLRMAANDEGEANKIRVLKRAEAEAGSIKINAEADAEAKYLAGTGIARQRQAIMNGLRESVLHFNEGVSDVDTRTVMDMMILTQVRYVRGGGVHSSTLLAMLTVPPLLPAPPVLRHAPRGGRVGQEPHARHPAQPGCDRRHQRLHPRRRHAGELNSQYVTLIVIVSGDTTCARLFRRCVAIPLNSQTFPAPPARLALRPAHRRRVGALTCALITQSRRRNRPHRIQKKASASPSRVVLPPWFIKRRCASPPAAAACNECVKDGLTIRNSTMSMMKMSLWRGVQRRLVIYAQCQSR